MPKPIAQAISLEKFQDFQSTREYSAKFSMKNINDLQYNVLFLVTLQM